MDEKRIVVMLTRKQAQINDEALEICIKVADQFNVTLPEYWREGVAELRRAYAESMKRTEGHGD